MATASLIEDEVREQLRERAIDPNVAPGQVRQVIAEVVESVRATRARVGLDQPDLEDVARDVFDSVVGLGPLQKYLDDPTIEEIWLNEPSRVFVARNGISELTNTILDHNHVQMLVERMLRSSGRRLDLSSPFCDASLNDGSRLHVAIPDITREFWAVNIRKFVASQYTLDDMVARGSLPRGLALILAACVEAGLNVLVSGQTQAGKTTMLNCLASAINPNERVVTCEEVFELQMSSRDWVAMQCRQPNLEGTGEVTLRMLVKEALRMRPSRIIVGEVRQAESLDLLLALNSGLPGLATLHANSAREALTKLCTLPLLAGPNISPNFVVPTVATAIDIVVHLGLDRTGRRTVREVLRVTGRVEGEQVETIALYQEGQSTFPRLLSAFDGENRFERAGISLTELAAQVAS